MRKQSGMPLATWRRIINPTLGTALKDSSCHLLRSDHSVEALECAGESVELYRYLAKDTPDTFNAELALVWDSFEFCVFEFRHCIQRNITCQIKTQALLFRSRSTCSLEFE
jgi:hypothetical protein